MEELSEDQIEEFREAFSLFDPDSKGYIQTKELATVLRSLGIYITTEEKNQFFEKYDQVQENNIYFSDFLEIILKKTSETKPEDELTEAFNLFDIDKKHEIDVEQFKADFRDYLPEIDDNEINVICNYLKHEKTNTINITEAVQKLSAKLNKHLK